MRRHHAEVSSSVKVLLPTCLANRALDHVLVLATGRFALLLTVAKANAAAFLIIAKLLSGVPVMEFEVCFTNIL